MGKKRQEQSSLVEVLCFVYIPQKNCGCAGPEMVIKLLQPKPIVSLSIQCYFTRSLFINSAH